MLSFRSQIPGRCHPRQGGVILQGPKNRVTLPTSGQLQGRRYHIGAIIPGGAIPFRPNTREALFLLGRIPGRRYPLWAKYQDGVTPFISYTRAAFPFRAKYQGGGTPFRSNTRAALLRKGESILYGGNTGAALSPLRQIPGRCYSVEAK